MRYTRRAQIPLWFACTLGLILILILALWTHQSTSTRTDGKEAIIFWGNVFDFGEEIYAAIHQFELRNPEYKVIMSPAVARDLTGDAQRLLSAVAGKVPPDVVWFDRFAIGEWAGRGALEDLRPLIESQNPRNPWDQKYAINLADFYPWAIEETEYRPPGSTQKPGIFGIATTADVRVLFSNSNILRQEGMVDAQGNPKPPTTWEELREASKKLTRYARPGDFNSEMTRLGFAPNYGNSWLYIYAWQAGGEFLSPDRTTCTLNSPPIRRALQYMVDVYDDCGGYSKARGFEQMFQQDTMDPFLRGLVVMKIDGDWRFENIAEFQPDFDFWISPGPMPADELAKGRKPITWAGGWSYVIPKSSRNKSGAFKLIQYLSSREAMLLLEYGKREKKESEGRLYMPRTFANRRIFEELVREAVDTNPRCPPAFKRAYAVQKELLPNTRIRPVSPAGQLLWQKHREALENAVNHGFVAKAQAAGKDEVQFCLDSATTDVQRALDELRTPPPPESRVNWPPYLFAYLLLVLTPFLAMIPVYYRRKREYAYKPREIGAALLFASPWIIGFVLFVGGPILFSVIISLTRYDVINPAHFVGLDNYRFILQDSLFFKSLGNTLFMILRIPLMMATSLAIALLLNRGLRGIGFYRTAYYMPAVVPLVAAALLWIWILNPNIGIVNEFLRWLFDTPLLRWAKLHPPEWLQDQYWAKPSLILMSVWSAGGGIIIWLAGLQSINPQLYEAASIDGAGPWQRFLHVTLPMLSPYTLFNFIIGVIGTMQYWQEAYIMTEGGGPGMSTLFYGYHLFREAFQFFRMGYASALSWILFVIVLILTILQLWLSTKWVHYEQE